MNWRPDVLFDLRTSAGFIHKRGWVSEGDELFAVRNGPRRAPATVNM